MHQAPAKTGESGPGAPLLTKRVLLELGGRCPVVEVADQPGLVGSRGPLAEHLPVGVLLDTEALVAGGEPHESALVLLDRMPNPLVHGPPVRGEQRRAWPPFHSHRFAPPAPRSGWPPPFLSKFFACCLARPCFPHALARSASGASPDSSPVPQVVLEGVHGLVHPADIEPRALKDRVRDLQGHLILLLLCRLLLLRPGHCEWRAA